ncbi:hybrid sensor histidine kinase/response regulator [Sphingomicrobium astaxanthinifaciens]|uniref:hybrid sensor histidine kinase/response regulator n=1 Tax=Sphingomicrobium astaxanthinifaciens TaxID=1227949 RepID=UPI001FCA557E|nr:response regulator [Sphingomicrobium astaxanthinifaciens]MCJ7422237.1 response regulator [Sphingomicrobium astaxanthinifaciens]
MLDRHAALAAELPEPRQRWLGPLLVGAALLSMLLLAWQDELGLAGGAVLLGALLLGALALDRARRDPVAASPPAPRASAEEFALAAAALRLVGEAAAVTDAEGRLLLANPQFDKRFAGDVQPFAAAIVGVHERLRGLALRDGQASDTLALGDEQVEAVLVRVGVGAERLLLWRFPVVGKPDRLEISAQRVAGETGDRLAAAGVLAALIDDAGRLVAANRPFSQRAIPVKPRPNLSLGELIEQRDDGHLHLVEEGEGAVPLRGVHVPLDPAAEGGAGTLLLFETAEAGGTATSDNVQALLELLPLGLALVDRDGRFLTMNAAFRLAGGIGEERVSYPGDLVVKEDKAIVADTVRRHARGPAMSGDIAVRLSINPKEPVALTVAGLRGIGDAAVLLLLKDNSEEAKLKRQIAQATKMQAVGQLAGGVAHDFNNILTAIIGHCDLMLMRHTPGDSDYGDIQQIKSNSNRAAGLTRQLLAFSRQQTLRPQVLQLADVVAEVSHLLKRLLGETVELKVKHGRDVGLVRADPGQLEQVIVNLAVNARDAMMEKGGGILTIQTYPVRADQVADIGSEILPVADYSALSISDTGSGIPPAVLGKIFEPFFTTKEVGKGTGLGLSTVYGIVKQSGGYIFADSKVGEGTSFVIYLPVHEVTEAAPVRAGGKTKDEQEEELWGQGTILLVEDEPMVRTVAERALTRHGYTVLTATNGEEALEILEKTDEEIALLVSDVVMPMMDGPTMGREARKDRPGLPILFMSGYAEEQLRKSIDIDNVDFLPKPFSVQELAEAVRDVLADE